MRVVEIERVRGNAVHERRARHVEPFLAAQHGGPSLIRYFSLRPTPAPPAARDAAIPLLMFRGLRAHDAALSAPSEACRVAVLGFSASPRRKGDEWLAVELADSLARKLGAHPRLEFIDHALVRSFERRHAKGKAAGLDKRRLAMLAHAAPGNQADLDLKRRITVAAFLSAAHTCE